MSFNEQFDPEILNDFIMESTELLEGLDQDLVTLEHEPSNLKLLDSIFRALHTIKGSSSFLAITPLTEFAHAAEDALNALRKGQAVVTAGVMDYLLAASDMLRRQLLALGENRIPDHGPEDLIADLKRIGTGETVRREGEPAKPSTQSTMAANETEDPGEAASLDEELLKLPGNKLDLLSYMIDDLVESINNMTDLINTIEDGTDKDLISTRMTDITSGLIRSVEFFEIDTIIQEVSALDAFARALPEMNPEALAQASSRALALIKVLDERSTALRDQKLIKLSTQTLIERLSLSLVGQVLDQTAQLAAAANIQDILIFDGVLGKLTASAEAGTEDGENTSKRSPADQGAGGNTAAGSDQTIRVDVKRLESMLNLMGELVLQKNRVLAISRRLASLDLDHETQEHFTQVASDLDRVTGELQSGVMKIRMQPLNKLFNLYPRLVRDLARNTGKEIDIEILGGETEVDKSVLELLGDPLVHILRNSADHGIEQPEERIAAGKDSTGRVRIIAGHEGNHVLVRICDDGRGLDKEGIGSRAVERGLVTKEDLDQMQDKEVFAFIFEPGFSTAQTLSDISGRGVGMDVVKTNIQRLNGSVDVDSNRGIGSVVSIRIPLTVAIMPAMIVRVDGERFAIPLTHVQEIVKPKASEISTIQGRPVMRLRQSVLPLIDLSRVFSERNRSETQPDYAVVVEQGGARVGLLVHQLVGQEEVVIKPLDSMFEHATMISGATVREDGGVSLILDTAALIKRANNQG